MEILDIVDELGNPTGETVERGKAHREGIRHRTAHMWILRVREGKLQALLQKRAQEKESYPGCYDISSAGHIPAGCGYLESALRELKEELGIIALKEEPVFCYDRIVSVDAVFHGVPFHERQVSRVFWLMRDLEEEAFTPQREELEAVRWMDLDEIIENVRNNPVMTGKTFTHCICLEEIETVRTVAKARWGL